MLFVFNIFVEQHKVPNNMDKGKGYLKGRIG